MYAVNCMATLRPRDLKFLFLRYTLYSLNLSSSGNSVARETRIKSCSVWKNFESEEIKSFQVENLEGSLHQLGLSQDMKRSISCQAVT